MTISTQSNLLGTVQLFTSTTYSFYLLTFAYSAGQIHVASSAHSIGLLPLSHLILIDLLWPLCSLESAYLASYNWFNSYAVRLSFIFCSLGLILFPTWTPLLIKLQSLQLGSSQIIQITWLGPLDLIHLAAALLVRCHRSGPLSSALGLVHLGAAFLAWHNRFSPR